MNREKTIELLETIQSTFPSKFSPDTRLKCIEENMNDVDEFVRLFDPSFLSCKEMIDEINSIYIPSKTQEKLAYFDLYEIFKDIENAKKVFEEASFKSKFVNFDKEIPVYGTIPLNRFSALVTSPGTDTDEIILISDGLFDFAFSICSMVAELFPVYPNKSLVLKDLLICKEDIETFVINYNIKQAFYYLILCYYYTLSCRNIFIMKQYTIESTEAFVNGFLRFSLAHEYCHFLLGHTRKISESEKLCDEVNYLEKSLDDELDADLYGAMLTLMILMEKGIIYPLNTFGINICLRSMGIIEKINLLHGTDNSKHPDYFSRRKRMDMLTMRSEIDYFASVDYLFDFMLQDFDDIIAGAIDTFSDSDISKEMLLEYVQKFVNY